VAGLSEKLRSGSGRLQYREGVLAVIFSKMMKRLGFLMLLCGLANIGFCLEISATNAAAAKNPYRKISTRNIFGLRPPPVIHTALPTAPLPKVILTGITTIMGGKRALFKIQFPARPREPAKIEYCTLAEGKRHGPIEVLMIDVKAATVKVNNSGTVAVITFEKQSPTPAPSAPRSSPYLPRFPVRSAAR
jgi:hypothetical protein